MNGFLSELILVFIGAVLGFISALIVNSSIAKYNNKLMHDKVKNRLVNEIKSIAEELEGAKTDDRIYFRFNYPVWKMCINSGYLFSISGDEIYSEFEKIYMLIESANNIEMEYYILATRLQENSYLINQFEQERINRRDDIIKCINELLRKYKGIRS